MNTENRWKNVLIEALVVCGIYRKAHEDDPRLALTELIHWETSVALDPCVSKEAEGLVNSVSQDKVSAICAAYEKGVDAGKSGDQSAPYESGSPEDMAHAMGFNLGYEYRLSNADNPQVLPPEQNGN